MEKRLQLVLPLMVGLVLALLSSRGVFELIDARVYDQFFLWRHQLGWDPKVDDRIVIAELDNETFSVVGQPVSRWADDYAAILDKLFAAGATAVGFDIIFHPELAKLPPHDAEQIYAEIELFGHKVLEHNVVLIDSFRPNHKELLTSIDILHAAAESKGNVGLNNLLTDRDGVVRSLGLFFYEEDPREIKNFAGRIASLVTGEKIVQSNGSVQGIRTEGTERLRINYPGPPGRVFQRVKVSDILEGQKLDLQGKICLLGPAYDSSNDLHSTPLDFNLGTLGVEIHASALNTMLSGQYLVVPGSWLHFVLALAGVGLGYLLATRVPTQILLAAGGCLLALYFGFTFLLFCKLGWLSPIAAPLLSFALAAGFAAVARYRALEHSRRYVQSVLGRFVSPQVMEELLASPDNLQLGGRRRRITVLFTDINNFTPLCEKRTPEEVITMLNEFFNEMLDIIFRYDGTVKQFVGDEIMVMYGAPNRADDHAKRAVLTARDMVRRLTELRDKNPGKPGFYEVKIGIHSGDVVVGNVGNERRSEYAAVGDPVNTAARIEGLTKTLDETILVSQETLQEIGDTLPEIEFISKGPQSFKGKADQMEVFGIRW